MTHVDDPIKDCSDVFELLTNYEQFAKQLRLVADMNDKGEVNEVMKFAIDGFGYKLSAITFRSYDGRIVKIKHV